MKAEQVLAIWSIMLMLSAIGLGILGIIIGVQAIVNTGLFLALICGLVGLAAQR